MITIEQIKEIKTTLAYAKSVLRQALIDLMFIDEIDLMDIEAMTFEKANDIRPSNPNPSFFPKQYRLGQHLIKIQYSQSSYQY